MKGKKTLLVIIAAVLLLGLTAGLVLAADDGPLFRRNISRTPRHDDRRLGDEHHVAVRAGAGHPGRAARHDLRRAGVLRR